MKKILFALVVAFTFFTGCESKNSNNVKVIINQNNDLTINYLFSADDNIILEITNKDKAIDDATINIAIYDNKNRLLGVEKKNIHKFSKGQKNIYKISYDEILPDSKDVKKVELTLTNTNYEYSNETSYIDQVKGNITKSTDEELNIKITNNSGKKIDLLDASIVFYKNGKIIDLYSILADNVDSEFTDKIYVPLISNKDGKMKYIDYDDVEIIINYAIAYVE